MKKLATILLMMLMMMTLASCGGGGEDMSSDDSQQQLGESLDDSTVGGDTTPTSTETTVAIDIKNDIMTVTVSGLAAEDFWHRLQQSKSDPNSEIIWKMNLSVAFLDLNVFGGEVFPSGDTAEFYYDKDKITFTSPIVDLPRMWASDDESRIIGEKHFDVTEIKETNIFLLGGEEEDYVVTILADDIAFSGAVSDGVRSIVYEDD